LTTENYDYIIVGAGASGATLAHRLVTESDATVLLIEAGNSDELQSISNTDINSMISLWGSDNDWKYLTENQPGLNDRQINIAQGKVLGGGTSINAMMYIRGSKKDFDNWASLGNPEWNYDNVLPYFKISEKYELGESKYHGGNGLLSVINYRNPSSVSLGFIEAAKELGYAEDNFDCNAEVHENGAFIYQSTRTLDNKRCSTSFAFLNPIANSKNFTLKTGTIVSKILIENKKATGVEIIQNGITHKIYSNNEVILCAGAFASPKLLMLSGIGSENTLNQFDIDIIQKLDGVGQNLQDHLLFGVGFKSKVAFDVPNLLSEAGLFTYTKELEEGKSPNLQFFFGPIQFVDPQYRIDAPAFTFAPILAQPSSRGYVGLKSSNPLDNSLVNPNYLSAQEDVDVLVYGIELARSLSRTKAMTEFTDFEIAPGANLTSKEELANYVRNSASTVWHPVGTCKMGIDDMSVVSQSLKVHGIEGLRVADASVMPTITSGNTNAAAIMIGEKAASYILNKV